MSVALGIQNQGDVGTTAAELRHIIASKWGSTGVVAGMAASGSGLAYDVAAGMAICSKGASDGMSEAWWEGGATPDVDANASSNPRIDAVWVTAHDATQGDADNLVAIGVTQGTPAATPRVPTIPTYATLVAAMLVPSGATSTSAASVYQRGASAVPYGASLGILVSAVDTTNSAEAVQAGYKTYASGSFTLPTARYVDVKRVFTLASKRSADSTVYTRVLVDGAQVASGEVRCFGAPTLATSQYMENTIRLEAGAHTVQAQMQAGVGEVRRYWSKGGWAGQTLQVIDAGIAGD